MPYHTVTVNLHALPDITLLLSPGFNPVFDEAFEFTVSSPEIAFLEFVVKDQSFSVAGKNVKLGHYILPVRSIAEGTLMIKISRNLFYDRRVRSLLLTRPFSSCPPKT